MSTSVDPIVSASGSDDRVSTSWAAAARGLGVCFGLFTVMNALGTLRDPGFDANLWWIDLRVLPTRLSAVLLLAAGALLVAFAVRPPASGRRRLATVVAVALLGLAALANTISFYLAWDRGTITPWFPVPLSLLVLGFLAFLMLMVGRVVSPMRGFLQWFVAVAMCVGFVVALPLAQIVFFGTTDYRRPADAIVVFGAKVHEGGVPSLSLMDRMDTAIELFDEGHAPIIIVSGGTGESGDNEAEVMKGMAVDAGVPEGAIIVDPDGVDTQSTVDNAETIGHAQGLDTLLAVSHPYHVPRIKLAFESTDLFVVTVPSETTSIPQLPGIVAREIPAFWVYYARALLG